MTSQTGACSTCKWARKRRTLAEEPYDGDPKGGSCGKPGRGGVTFVPRQKPDYTLPAHECWDAP